jgi:phage terminase large subunit-like protein/flagellar motor switch/type III secretory pathway protein FliN
LRKLKNYKPTRFMAEDSVYNKVAADYAVAFIEALSHTKGVWAGKPFELIDWQEQIVRDIFGILKPNGYRQFNTAYVEIPKKMGKSELAAAIALLLTCGDGEERAEVYGCAADRQQASIVFEVAADMVRMCPALAKRVKLLASSKRLIYLPTNSFYQVLSAEAYSKHGFNVHGVVFDELHTQPNRKLFDVMTKGSGDARAQPLFFLITTAGTDTQSICYETHQKAVDIMEGRKHDPTFYPVIYGAKEDEDWTDPEVWKKANPSLGITVSIDKVRAACESAKQNPAEENSFRQLRLNQWVKQSVRWMPMAKWDACAFLVDPKRLEGRICYGGLDLSSTTDLTAFVLVFPPEDEDDKYSVLPYFWMPEANIDLRVRRDHVQYDLWKKQGYLFTTEGNVVHYGFIEKFIEDLGTRFNICIPFRTLEPVLSKITQHRLFESLTPPDPEKLAQLRERVKSAVLPIEVELGAAIVSVNDLLTLEIGDVIELDRKRSENVDVKVGSLTKFKGTPGKLGDKLGVVITSICESQEE